MEDNKKNNRNTMPELDLSEVLSAAPMDAILPEPITSEDRVELQGQDAFDFPEEEVPLFAEAFLPDEEPEQIQEEAAAPVELFAENSPTEVPGEDVPTAEVLPTVESPGEAISQQLPAEEAAWDTTPEAALDHLFSDFLTQGEAAEATPEAFAAGTENTSATLMWAASQDAGTQTQESLCSAPSQNNIAFLSQESAPAASVPDAPRLRPAVRKGRPKRKKGYGLFGLPHLAATLVWLAIIVMIGTSLGRMLWVAAADVLAFGRESKKVSITITSNDTIDDITEKLHDAGLIRYPAVFKFYASIAVDEGDILPGTFEMDTIYDYHALVVQMGPRSSNRAVVEDVLIPEGLNCRQIFELLEQHNICTVKELEEYAANGEFADFWFLEGVERGDKYCLEGFLFPDTYDFYAYSTPREALGKMLLGFEARFTQEIYDQLPALNERLSAMMRGKGCSEEYIAEHQLDLRDLLTVASLIEEETASVKESPIIASVIFNRLTEDQIYERYLNIDAAIIYATGDASNIDTSIDHPYNTYKYPGLTPGPISNPGLDSILAALNFADTDYYYYVLNPETGMHQFSMTLAEHEGYVEQFRGMGG